MSMFPGPNANVYYNEAGEPIGWDYPADDFDPGDPYEDYDRYQAKYGAYEDAYEQGQWDAENDEPLNPNCYPTNKELQKVYEQGYSENKMEETEDGNNS